MYKDVSIEKQEEYNHFILRNNFLNPLYILPHPLPIIQYVYTSYIYTHLNNIDICSLNIPHKCQPMPSRASC